MTAGTQTTAGAPAPAAPAAAQPPKLVRFAVDSDDPGSLFAADFVRTYADLIPTAAALADLQARFPDSVVELIDRGLGDPTGTANWFDVEPGALTAAQAADRIRAGHATGRQWLGAYCDEADLADVVAACQGLDYWHWIAAPGSMVVPSHRDAQVQFVFAQMLGLHADLTVIWNPAYRPAAAAAPAALAAAAAAGAAGAVPAAAGEALDALHGLYQHVLAQHHGIHGELAMLESRATELFSRHAEVIGTLENFLAPELAHLLP